MQSATLIKTTRPASPILGRSHFSAVTPTLLPSRSSLSRILSAHATPGSGRHLYPGDQARAGSAGSQLCPCGFRRPHPNLGLPALLPRRGRAGARGARATGLSHLGVAFEFQVVVLCPDLEILVAHPPAPRHCHPVKFPPQGIRACSIHPTSSTGGSSPMGLSSHCPRSAAFGNLQHGSFIFVI